MEKELKEKIIEILKNFGYAITDLESERTTEIQKAEAQMEAEKEYADQILELFKQEKEKLYDYCFKKCGEECEKAIKQRKENWRKELREKIEKLYVTKGVDYYSILDLLKDEK